MTQRNTNPRLICYLSAVALSVAGCSQNTTKVKTTTPQLTDIQPTPPPSEGTASRLFHYSKKGLRQVKIKDTRSTKRVQYEYANLWDRLFDSYSLPDVRNHAVEREVSWFVNHPSYLQRAQQRAEPFLYNIVQQIERQGVPGEIALLPVVESAFQAQAVSPAKAAGIWQFIPATGRHYGLRQNHAYDGRRDVYASTKAAIKYLKKLNRQFNGDWLLAIAAYNCGEGAVERAVQRNGYRDLPTDFWSLDLPQETRSYVPRLLAVSRLMADADHYGVDLLHIPNQAVYKPVKVSQQLDLVLAADAADMSLEQFRALNPGFKNTFIDPEGSVRLFVPASKSKTFKKELARLASVQSDLLHREFERTRDSADDLSGSRPGMVAALSDHARSQTGATVPSAGWGHSSGDSSIAPDRAERTATMTRPASMTIPEGAAAKAKPYSIDTAYVEPEASSNPFRAPRLAEQFDLTEPAAEEPRHKRGKRTHYQSLSSRSTHGHHQAIRASELKKNSRTVARKQEARKSERAHALKQATQPAISYRYAEDPSPRKSTSKQQAKARPGLAKPTFADGRETTTKSSKWTVVSAKPSGNTKGRERGATASGGSSRTGSKSSDSRKTERILTAKADTPKVKGRR